MKIYRCKHCGNIVVKLEDSGVDVVCCNEKMKELHVNTTDGAKEKHVPVCNVDKNNYMIVIGETGHPMLEEHYISWIILEEEDGFQVKFLKPGEKPQTNFYTDKKVTAVYEYCNLHGLWKLDINK